MNCNTFKEALHEYLDETLQAGVQAAAREHLQQCADCRRAVLEEETFAKSISDSLERATAGLCLGADARRRILALEATPPRPGAWSQAWQSFLSAAMRPAWASAALLCLLPIFFGIQFYRTRDRLPKSPAPENRYSRVIHVPIPVQTHSFHRRNDEVVDAMISSIAVGHAVLFENTESSPKPLPRSL